MQVTETQAEGLKRTYVAKATASEIEARIDEKIAEVQPTAQLKGFRKGKAPAALLKKMFGEGMKNEAIQELVDSTIKSHFDETGHRPAQQPQIRVVGRDGAEAEAEPEPLQDGEDLDVEFSYEMLPDVPEIALGEIKLERLAARIEDSAVDEALGNIAKSAREFGGKDGAAETGDQVVIDFVGKIDGEPFEGGAAEDFPLELGSGQFIPGFEEQLAGASAGEERAVTVSFPEDYGAAGLAGREAVFDVTVKEVRAPQEAELDDALAQKFGAESLDALKEQIRSRLGEEYRGAARALMKRHLLDHLDAAVSFELPPSMVESEARQIAQQLRQDAAAAEAREAGGDADAGAEPDAEAADAAAADGDADADAGPAAGEEPAAAAQEPDDEHVRLAERRVKLGLLLADIGAANNITLTDQESQAAVMRRARDYPGHEREFLEFVRGNPAIMQSLTAPAYEDKVVDYVFELAQVSEKGVSVDELKSALDALDDE